MKYVIFILLMTSALQAWLRPEQGKFALQGEVLWLHASLEDTYYEIDASLASGITGERNHLEFGFLPAYRIEGAFTFCNAINDFRLRGTYYSHTITDTKTANLDAGTALLPTQVPPSLASFFGGVCNFANAKNHANYYEIDGKFGHMIFNDCQLNLFLQVGLHYMRLKTSENYHYAVLTDSVGPFIQIVYDDTVWGIGPEVGLDFRYLFPSFLFFHCGQLSFVGNIQGILLAAKNKASVETSNSVSPLPFFHFDFSNDPNWRVVPAVDIQLGFNYLHSFCCVLFSLEVGYEFINYHKPLDKVRILDAPQGGTTGISIDKYSDFGLHGPYIALGLTY